MRVLTQVRKQNILLLSETHLTDKILNREVGIRNYEIIRADSNSRHTGGVAIYIQKNLNYKIKSNEKLDSNTWILSIEVTEHKTLNGQYTVVYHSPSSSDAEFLKFFSEWMENNNNEEKSHIICGDFNIDMSTTSNKTLYKNKLNEIIHKNGMTQKIDKYTRITQNTQTMIDLVITNTNNIQCEISDKDNISDHATINIIWKDRFCENEQIEKKTILYKYNKQLFENELKQKNYDYCYDESINCSIKAEKLIEAVRESIHKFKKEVEIRQNDSNKWFDKHLRETKNKRDEAYRKAQNTNDGELWSIYRQSRNKYNKMIKKREQQLHQKNNNRMQR